MSQKPYGLLCPLSKASEFLEPRWTIQVLSELWLGSTRFNEIRRGVGNISPGILSKRLKELEDAGLVERVEDKAAGTVDYFRTDKAIALEPALNALAAWAQCNIDAEIALRDTDVSTLMWRMRGSIKTEELPMQRVVIRFHFSDKDLARDTYWMLVQPGAPVELCLSDHAGRDVDLFVETTVMSLGGILLGRTNIAREIEQGALFLSGDARLARTMDRWLRKSEYAEIDGIVMLPYRPRIGAERANLAENM